MLTLAKMSGWLVSSLWSGMLLYSGVLLYLALWPKPAHDEARCGKCGYTLSGLGQAVPCPECGSDLEVVGITPPAKDARGAFRRATYLLLGLALLWIPAIVGAYSGVGLKVYIDATHRLQPRSNIYQDVELTWRETLGTGTPGGAPVSQIYLVLTLNDGRKVNRWIQLGSGRTQGEVAIEVQTWLQSDEFALASPKNEVVHKELAGVVATAFGGIRTLTTPSIELQTIASSNVRTSERPVWLSLLIVLAVPVTLIAGAWQVVRVVGEEPSSSPGA
ncbi:MAG: hypothetical protein AABZ53_12500 [Planctomycetota bacterium]